jgi:hypothetical protein
LDSERDKVPTILVASRAFQTGDTVSQPLEAVWAVGADDFCEKVGLCVDIFLDGKTVDVFGQCF